MSNRLRPIADIRHGVSINIYGGLILGVIL